MTAKMISINDSIGELRMLFQTAGGGAGVIWEISVQMQLAKRRDAVPLTRDYIAEWERAHAAEAIPCTPKRAA